MANKYQRISDQLAEDRRRRAMCTGKLGFDTEAAAKQKGQRVYRCDYCRSWHRTSMSVSLKQLRPDKNLEKRLRQLRRE